MSKLSVRKPRANELAAVFSFVKARIDPGDCCV